MFPFAMRGWFVTIGDMPACRQRFQLDYVPLERYSRHSPSPSTNNMLKKKKKQTRFMQPYVTIKMLLSPHL